MHDARGRKAPEGECIYIRQRMSACVITNIYHFQHQNPSEILFEDILMIFRNYNYRNIIFISFWHCVQVLTIVNASFRHLYICCKFQDMAQKLKPTIIVIWAAYIKLMAYHQFIKGFQDCLECFNENKCAMFFISHTYIIKCAI